MMKLEGDEDIQITCRGRGRCGQQFSIRDIDENKTKISGATHHITTECPHCGKSTIVTRSDLGDKYDQVKRALDTKIEEGEKKKEENFEAYYAEGDTDSIVVDGGLDPEKVIGKILRRWDQDSELHKDYGRLALMMQKYI